MKPRLLLVFLVIVLVPAGLVAWLGMRVSEEEQHRERRQLQAIMTETLASTRTGIDRLVEDRSREIYAALEKATVVSNEERREMSRQHPWIRQLFQVTSTGEFLFPDVNQPAALTQRERDFFTRSQAFWDSGPNLGQADEEGRAPSRGWRTWYWNDGLHIMAWSRNLKTGEIVGAEIERMRLLAEVLSSLPSAGTDDRIPEQAHIQLRDVSNRLLYAWGGFEPEENAAPLTELKLHEPLSGWRLEYFSNLPIYYEAGTPSSFGVGWLLGATLLASLGLAFYFFREANRDMREAGQRVTFVNQVSHELKTPLTNIRLYAEMLEAKLEPGDAETRRSVDVIVDESQRLSRLISNVLTFSQARQEKLGIRRQSAEIDEVIESAIEQFRPTLEKLGFRIEFEANASTRCQVDPDALEQILINLVGNVEKYATEGKYLGLRSQLEDGIATIQVCDHGPGIADDQCERVFLPFERLSSKLSDAAGTGIGLNIARNLARMHGGDVVAGPVEGGKGLCMTLTLNIDPLNSTP